MDIEFTLGGGVSGMIVNFDDYILYNSKNHIIYFKELECENSFTIEKINNTYIIKDENDNTLYSIETDDTTDSFTLKNEEGTNIIPNGKYSEAVELNDILVLVLKNEGIKVIYSMAGIDIIKTSTNISIKYNDSEITDYINGPDIMWNCKFLYNGNEFEPTWDDLIITNFHNDYDLVNVYYKKYNDGSYFINISIKMLSRCFIYTLQESNELRLLFSTMSILPFFIMQLGEQIMDPSVFNGKTGIIAYNNKVYYVEDDWQPQIGIIVNLDNYDPNSFVDFSLPKYDSRTKKFYYDTDPDSGYPKFDNKNVYLWEEPFAVVVINSTGASSSTDAPSTETSILLSNFIEQWKKDMCYVNHKLDKLSNFHRRNHNITLSQFMNCDSKKL